MKRIIGVFSIAAIMMLGSTTAEAQGYYRETQVRKAWSHRATGAVVGAGSGAVIGALVNRNDRAAGAAIGSVVGAGLGYLVGQREDRINPRPQYVKKTRVYNQYGQVVHKKKRYTNNPRGAQYNQRQYRNSYNNNSGYSYYR